MLNCNYLRPNNDELYHYGVLGMKWGVHRARSKMKQSNKLAKKAAVYDKKSAKMTKKSEKIHAKKDLGRANRAAKKAATYRIKSAKLEKKALKTDNEFKRSILESRAANLNYKASRKQIKANILSKTKGYGVKAMKYSIKSDKLARKSAKARKRIASNERYKSMMKRKASSISPEDLKGAYKFVQSLYD